MDRRSFLRHALAATAGGAALPALWSSAAGAQTAAPGAGPYGPLSPEPDANGLLLPDGFSSRVVAVAGEPVGATDYLWHAFPDGAATFEADDGGWIHTVNSEVFAPLTPTPSGGVSAIRYDADGAIVDAYRILEGTHSNCAGGPTPWGTWLSCEEALDDLGLVYECDPTGERPGVAHEAMGRWAHEAAAVDPETETLYLTEDRPDGLLYRYTPESYPDLSAGLLEACTVAGDGAVTWQPVPDPSAAAAPTRTQVPGATTFAGAEGIWYHQGSIFFTTKLDHSVHVIDVAAQRHSVLWRGDPDRLGVEGAVLSGVDNITVDAGSGDLFVAEDGGNMEVVLITPQGEVAPFVRIVQPGHEGSEMTGPCFNPARDRLYFSSQRGPTPKSIKDIVPGIALDGSNGGITYEVTGPFRAIQPQPTTTVTTAPSATTTLAAAADGSGGGDGGDDGGVPGAVIGGVGVAVVAAAAGAVALRRRGAGSGGDGTA